jgi:hypothetical protein
MKQKSSSAVEVLRLHFFGDNSTKLAGCAYTAIALLTGEDPFFLRRLYRDQDGMPPRTIKKHMLRAGFQLKEINNEYLYSLIKAGTYLTDSHPILASVRMSKREATWVVFYGGTMWHNFQPMSTSYVSSFSYPMEYAWKLWNPDWRDMGVKNIKKQLDTWKLTDKKSSK